MARFDREDWKSVPTHRRYLQSLLDGDSEGAEEVLLEILGQQLPRRLYLDLAGPAMVQLGAEWQSGRINIAQCNHASQIVLAHLGLLRRLASRKPALNRKVVITALAGDCHTMGARMVADFLHLEGFQVDFLGAGTPSSALIDFVKERKPDLVGLSVSMRECLRSLERTVRALWELSPRPAILAGGRAIPARSLGRIGLDGFGSDAADAVIEARRLLGLAEKVPSLDEFLGRFGSRIQKLRRSRGWSQTCLATLAGVDRTYVSSVENGKQNLTVSVAFRLAEALQIPLELLLGGGWNSRLSTGDPKNSPRHDRHPDDRAVRLDP